MNNAFHSAVIASDQRNPGESRVMLAKNMPSQGNRRRHYTEKLKKASTVRAPIHSTEVATVLQSMPEILPEGEVCYHGIPLNNTGKFVSAKTNLCMWDILKQLFDNVRTDVESVTGERSWLKQGAMNVYAQFYMDTLPPSKKQSSICLNVSSWKFDPHVRCDCIVNLFIVHTQSHWSLAVVMKEVSTNLFRCCYYIATSPELSLIRSVYYL